MTFEFLKWGRWPVGTFVQMAGVIGGIPVTVERILIFVDEKEYVLQQNTIIGGQKSTQNIRRIHAPKSITKGKVKDFSMGKETIECTEFTIVYMDGCEEIQYMRTSVPLSECKLYTFFFKKFF